MPHSCPPTLPVLLQMLAAGKRLLFVSGSDYEEAMEPLIFSRGDMLCGWNEPPLGAVDGTPQCQINQQGLVEVGLPWAVVGQPACSRVAAALHVHCCARRPPPGKTRPTLATRPSPSRLQPRSLFDGLLTRVISCELQYGPMNCEFAWHGTNQPIFDELTLPPVRAVVAGLGGPVPPGHSCTRRHCFQMAPRVLGVAFVSDATKH